MRIKKSFFTLFEMLIVLALLLCLAGVGGVSLYRMITYERFQSEVNLVAQKLQQAQDFAMIYDHTATVFFRYEKGCLICKWSTDKPLNEWIEKRMAKPQTLKWIDKIEWIPEQGTSKEGEIGMKFFAWKGTSLKGKLQFSSSHDNYKNFIEFIGQPCPIEVGKERLLFLSDTREKDYVYPKEFLQHL